MYEFSLVLLGLCIGLAFRFVQAVYADAPPPNKGGSNVQTRNTAPQTNNTTLPRTRTIINLDQMPKPNVRRVK